MVMGEESKAKNLFFFLIWKTKSAFDNEVVLGQVKVTLKINT